MKELLRVISKKRDESAFARFRSFVEATARQESYDVTSRRDQPSPRLRLGKQVVESRLLSFRRRHACRYPPSLELPSLLKLRRDKTARQAASDFIHRSLLSHVRFATACQELLMIRVVFCSRQLHRGFTFYVAFPKGSIRPASGGFSHLCLARR